MIKWEVSPYVGFTQYYLEYGDDGLCLVLADFAGTDFHNNDKSHQYELVINPIPISRQGVCLRNAAPELDECSLDEAKHRAVGLAIERLELERDMIENALRLLRDCVDEKEAHETPSDGTKSGT